MAKSKLEISLAVPPIDLARIVSPGVEGVADVQTIDKILAQIKRYEQQCNGRGEVGVALIQNPGRAGSYWVATYSEARPGTKIDNWSWYVRFWPKSYFLDLRQKLLRGGNT